MTPLLFLGVALAGGLGAASRLFVDGVLTARLGSGVPWGTLVINLAGSFALGLIAGLATAQLVPASLHAIVGAGFLGGFTTFSTASVEMVRRIHSGKKLAGTLYGLGTLIAATGLAALGLWIGGRW